MNGVAGYQAYPCAVQDLDNHDRRCAFINFSECFQCVGASGTEFGFGLGDTDLYCGAVGEFSEAAWSFVAG